MSSLTTLGTALGGGGAWAGAQYVAGFIRDRRQGKSDDTKFLVTGSRSAVETMGKTLAAVQDRAEALDRDLARLTRTLQQWMDYSLRCAQLLDQHNIPRPTPPPTIGVDLTENERGT